MRVFFREVACKLLIKIKKTNIILINEETMRDELEGLKLWEKLYIWSVIPESAAT